jgi:hypothetical protein
VLSLREALVRAKKINKHVKCQWYHGLAFFSATYSHPPSCVTAVPLSADHSEAVEYSKWSYLLTLMKSITAMIRTEFDQKAGSVNSNGKVGGR